MSDRGITVEDLESLDSVISTPKEKKKKAATSKPKRSSSSPLSKRVEKMIRLLGTVVEGFDKFDGQVLKDNAPELATALADLAQESPRVRAILEGTIEGGAWTALGLMVGGKVALPVAVHHAWLPEPMNSNLAGSMEIPVRKKKGKVRPAPDTPGHTIPEAEDELDPEEPGKIYGVVRDPETGKMVRVELGPDHRPKVDGDGRPIIENDE